VQSSNYPAIFKNVFINFVNYNLNTYKTYAVVLTVLRRDRGLPEQARSTSSVFIPWQYDACSNFVRSKFNSHQPMHFLIQRCISLL